jgi:hypothetical protein
MMEERSGSMGLAPQEKLRDSKRMMCQPYGKTHSVPPNIRTSQIFGDA